MQSPNLASKIRLADDHGGTDRLFLQLNNLRAVAAIARSGSMAAAARHLGSSASSLTRATAELEDALRVPLLERRRGKVAPTPHGSALFARVSRIEAEIGGAKAELVRNVGSSGAAIEHLLSSGRKLLLLIHIAEAGSVSGAAALSGISQAGVSQALARIEEAIASPLFHRSVRGVFPTDAGSRLILRSRLIRAELRHSLSDLASLVGSPAGTTIIGTLPMARADILPRAIGACFDASPQLRVQVVEAQREALLAQLRSGEIDAVLSARSANFDPRGLSVESLFRDRLIIAASRGHALAAAVGVTLDQIASARWILPWENAVSRTLFDAQFVRRGITPPVPLIETGDLLVMRPLLARGDMLAFTSSSLVRFEIEAGLLVEIEVEMDELIREVVLLLREKAQLPTSALLLVEALRTVVGRP